MAEQELHPPFVLESKPGSGVELSFRRTGEGYLEPFAIATGEKLANVVSCEVATRVDGLTSITVEVLAVCPPEEPVEALRSASGPDPCPNPQWQPLAYREWFARHPEVTMPEALRP